MPLVRAPNTLMLTPIADSYVSVGDQNVNFGGSSYLRVWNWSATLGYRTYLKFDLTSIPSGATIESAELELYDSYRTGDATSNVEAHYCPDSSWTEIGITWNNAPTFEPTPSATTQVAFADKWYSWVLTEDVIRAMPNQQISMALVSSSTSIENFYSKEPSYAAEYIPKLTIMYAAINNSPTPTPTPSFTPISTLLPTTQTPSSTSSIPEFSSIFLVLLVLTLGLCVTINYRNK